MRTWLLCWWRWKSRHDVKIILNRSDGTMYIVWNRKEDIGRTTMFWNDNERRFKYVDFNPKSYTFFKHRSEAVAALERARRNYIMNLLCIKRMDNAEKELTRL